MKDPRIEEAERLEEEAKILRALFKDDQKNAALVAYYAAVNNMLTMISGKEMYRDSGWSYQDSFERDAEELAEFFRENA